jgi:hypothetical protein
MNCFLIRKMRAILMVGSPVFLLDFLEVFSLPEVIHKLVIPCSNAREVKKTSDAYHDKNGS